MRPNRPGSLFTALLLLATGCIEPFNPRLEENPEDIFVVTGEVTDQPGYQTITISRASPINDPKYLPASGCQVSVEDDRGNSFELEETTEGNYKVWMDQEFLAPGISYRVRIITPDGDEILSGFDRMPDCPDLDSVYSERKEIFNPNTKQTLNGLQFYLDFRGDESDSRYYRWTAEETWEYHAPYPLVYYYNGKVNKVWPPDYSLSVCWATSVVNHIFTLSTDDLVSNGYEKMPIHYVDNTTNRLLVGYSLLVTQHALSKQAYDFWEQMRINSKGQGGLYEKQPLPVQGNLRNVTRPGLKVLGFFEASGISRKRIFVEGITDMNIGDGSLCFLEEMGVGGWKTFLPWEYPVYFVYVNYQVWTLQWPCVDCRAGGGVTAKPEFWPR